MASKKTFFLLCILFLTHLSYAQSGKQVEEITTIMQNYAKAVEKYDTATIEKLFDDKMIVTSANGNYRNKQQEVNDLLYKPSNSTLEFFVAENLNIIADGQTAIVKGILKWKFNNEPATARTFTFTLVKKDKSWKILAQHIGKTSP